MKYENFTDSGILFARAKRIPGTRSCHRFNPISSSILEIMRTSDEDDCPIKCNLEIGAKQLQFDLIGKFVACILDNNWWIDVVKDVSEIDSEVQLMQFNSGAKTFRWTTKEDVC